MTRVSPAGSVALAGGLASVRSQQRCTKASIWAKMLPSGKFQGLRNGLLHGVMAADNLVRQGIYWCILDKITGI